MTNIRIIDLPLDTTPNAGDVTAVDGTSTRKASLTSLVNAGRPFASQAEAEAGTSPTKGMSPLATAQAIAAIGGAAFAASAQGLPTGGTTNQVLGKTGSGDFAVSWRNAGAGDMISINNLADVANAATALGNLGGLSSALAASTYLTQVAAASTYQPIGSYQPQASNLTSWAAVTRAAGYDTFATGPTSANLKALVTDETGSGALVFATSPTLVTPALGTPTALVLTNAAGLTIAGGGTGASAADAARLNLGAPTYVANRTALAALDPTKDKVALIWNEGGRNGTFIFSSSNLASLVTLDTAQGVYVAPTSAPTGASGAWVRLTLQFLPEHFGALADGATDDSTALQAWASALNFVNAIHLSGKSYLFTTTITFPQVSDRSILGAGIYSSKLIYAGASTTRDLFVWGPTSTHTDSTGIKGWFVRDFMITSSTTMTGGYAAHFKNVDELHIDHVSMDGMGGAFKLYHGFYFDDMQQVYLHGSPGRCQGTLIAASDNVVDGGGTYIAHGADLYIDKVFTANCNRFVHLGGGIGGLYLGANCAFGCGDTVVIDNALQSRPNREIFWGPQMVSDGPQRVGLWLNDTLISNAPVIISGMIDGAGIPNPAASPRYGIYVQNWPNGRINITGAHIFNNLTHGISVNDTSCLLEIDSATYIFNNGKDNTAFSGAVGYGIYAGSTYDNISCYAKCYSNGLGNFHTNVRGEGHWIDYTPTLTAGSGTITSYTATGRYFKNREEIDYQFEATITNNGTGATSLIATAPVPSGGYGIFSGRNQNNGDVLNGVIQSSSLIAIYKTGNAYPVATGQTIVQSGRYKY